MQSLGERVRHMREQNGISQARLAEMAGTSQQAIQQIESGKTERPRFLHEIAQALGVTADWLRTGKDGPVATQTIRQIADYLNIPASDITGEGGLPAPATGGGGTAMFGPDMVPVYGYVSGSDGHYVALNDGNIVEYSPRHPAQKGLKDAFKVYVLGDSMEPRYFENEIVAVHPGRLPSKGEDCVVLMHDGHAVVKRYCGQDENAVHVSQYNPPRDFTISKAEIEKIFVVVGRG